MPHWPHAPPHLLREAGIYMVTAGTYLKTHLFHTEESLSFLQQQLLSLSRAAGWELHAWALFTNHYHFIARSPTDPTNLTGWLAQLHQSTASMVNQQDNTIGRRVWYRFWDSKITIHTSYLARLNYVHQNPVKHGVVEKASAYRWGSAFQFEQGADKSFVRSVYSFDYSKLNVVDDF